VDIKRTLPKIVRKFCEEKNYKNTGFVCFEKKNGIFVGDIPICRVFKPCPRHQTIIYIKSDSLNFNSWILAVCW